MQSSGEVFLPSALACGLRPLLFFFFDSSTSAWVMDGQAGYLSQKSPPTTTTTWCLTRLSVFSVLKWFFCFLPYLTYIRKSGSAINTISKREKATDSAICLVVQFITFPSSFSYSTFTRVYPKDNQTPIEPSSSPLHISKPYSANPAIIKPYLH